MDTEESSSLLGIPLAERIGGHLSRKLPIRHLGVPHHIDPCPFRPTFLPRGVSSTELARTSRALAPVPSVWRYDSSLVPEPPQPA